MTTTPSDKLLHTISELKTATGWYIKTAAGTAGPMDSVVLQERLAQEGGNPLVCQKGFSRWYHASEVRGILDRSVEWEKQTAEGFNDFQKTFLEGLSRLSQHEGHDRIKVKPQEISTQARPFADFSVSSAALPPLPQPRSAPAELPLQHPLTHSEKDLKNIDAQIPKVELTETLSSELIDLEAATTVVVSPAETLPSYATLDFVAELPRDYFLFRGRLRLGMLRSRWGAAFKALLSLGIYFVFWGARVRKEVLWHLGIDVYRRSLPGFLFFIPGIHIVGMGVLANKIKKMESQNGYQATSVPLAILLGIFPPLGCLYIQHKLNRHWLAHARLGMRQGMVDA